MHVTCNCEQIQKEDLMIFRNSEKFNGIAFVCYLDVLGFSDDVLNNWSKTPSPLEGYFCTTPRKGILRLNKYII
jgi:hypothetical protein